MDNNDNNPNDSLLARPAQALRILMGIDNMGIKKLKGQAALIDKPGTIDDLEKRVPKNFLGYNDGTALDRVSKYREFDRMDVLSPEIHTALDIYAEEASQNDNKTGLKVWIDSEKPNVAEELNAMLQRIKQDKKVYGHYRNLAKYGDLFLYLNLGGYGIHDTYYVHPSRMERIQSDGLLGFKSHDLAQIIPMDNKEGLFKPWDFCVDSTTEILTEMRGWVLFKDLLSEDKVATRNIKSKELEWQQPSNYINSPYTGDMFKIKSSSVDMLVTPNHRMLVTQGKNKEEVFLTAEEIFNSNKYQSYYKIPMTSSWIGEEIQEKTFTVEYKGVGKKPASFTMSGDDYVAFMAMYLSEGHTNKRKQITIGQYIESKGYKPYKELLERIFDKEILHNGKTFSFNLDALGSFLQEFGLSENKYIPSDILNSSSRQLQIFWNYYMLGDGSSYKRQTKTNRTVGTRKGVYTTIHTTSKTLSGQLQEIVQKLGLSASVWTRPAYTKTRKKDGHKFECKESYVVAVRHKTDMSFKITKEIYNDTIHCVTVPNSTIYIRRNGKPAWTGNCHMTCGAYDNESVYGSSFLDALRKAWNQQAQLETMITLYRISKAVQRNVFEVDTGQSSVPEAMQIVKEYDKMLRNKTTFIDPVTKQFKLDFNPATLLQDIIWPTRPGSTSKITQLKSDGNLGSLEDLEYWKSKVRMGLGIPKDYFDGEYSGTWNSKEALMLQDVRFGRKISKLQDGLRDGMVRLCQIHWAITHQEFLDPSAFIVNLGSISDSAERGREEVLLRKAQVLEILANVSVVLGWNRWAWSDYLLDEVFPLPAKLRQKFYTPDPKEEMDQEAALELKKVGGSTGPGGTQKGGGSSKAKPNKPAKKATPDSVRRGLMKFGGKESLEDIYEEFPTVLEEIEQIEGELEEIEEHVEYLNSNSQYGFKKGEIDELIKVYKKTDVLPLNESTTNLSKEEFNNERAKALFIESRKINIIKLNEMANAPEPLEFVE